LLSLFISIIFVVIISITLKYPAIFSLFAYQAKGNQTLSLTQYVNPFIGTTSSGNTFPGVDYPMGMVQWSPDTSSNPNSGGYKYTDTQIRDFSLTHYSGGGCPRLEDFPFMPYNGPITQSPATNNSLYWSTFSHGSPNEIAQPGYYKVNLQNPQVTVELTATPHTGFGKFTYSPSTQSAMIINAAGSVNKITAAGININPATMDVTGNVTSTVGCRNNPYKVYFAAHFDQPFTSYGTWNGNTVTPNSTTSSGIQSGGYLVFDTTTNPSVQAQVGISFVSIANAEANLATENANWNFAQAQSNATSTWNTRLNSIQVQGGSGNEKTVFYTALYHTLLDPSIFSDANGQYLGFDNQIHTVQVGHNQYDNIPGWDQYRSFVALHSILFPNEMSDILQSLVNDAQQGDGHLPRWVQENVDSKSMIGDSADAYIANGFAYGATNFDTTSALNAMLNNQSVLRDGLSDYQNLGYVSDTYLQSVAKTLEYTSDDYSIANFALALGNSCSSPTVTNYLSRATNWKNLFNSTSLYMQPKTATGTWEANFSPTSETGFIEGNSTQYSFMVPYDLPNLFTMMGGNAAVVSRLDNFFTILNGKGTSPNAAMGNEPSFEVPWEYDFTNSPSHTQSVVRNIQLKLFKNATNGLPGNDDGGEMSSWYVLSALGLYPEIPGVPGFVIGSPLFPSENINLPNGNAIQIIGTNASETNPYVQAMQLNNQPNSNLWIPWNNLQNGANLNFTLGSTPSTWGTMPDMSTCPTPTPTPTP
ncbi:MAG TPA: GH92 family glycosyl hydrolase, partial [Patescibacteria group bacterium]